MNVKEWHQSNICIVINDKSQGSIAKHLSFNQQVKEFLTFGKVTGKMVDCFMRPIHPSCSFVLKDADLAR